MPVATTITNNSPGAGSIAWTTFNIAYAGQAYTVPAGSSAGKYVWWKYNTGAAAGQAGAPQVLGSDTFPAMTTDDTILFLNKAGMGIFLPESTILDGSLIVPDSILAPQIAADQVQAKHLAVGSVEADAIAAGAVTTNSLSVGSVSDNLVANGSFEDFVGGTLEGWQLAAQSLGTVTPVTGVSSSGAVSVQFDATSTTSYLSLRQAAAKFIPVSAASGRRWYFSVRMGAGTPTTKGAYMRVNWYDGNRAPLPAGSTYTDVVSNAGLTGTFTVLDGQATPPAAAKFAGIELLLASPNVATKVYVDEVAAHQVTVSARIGDGQITAAKLETDLVLATRILAGPESGTHAEMSPGGFRVYAADPLGGPAKEVVRLGVAETSDFLAVTSPTGDLVTSIDETGKVSGMELHAKTTMTYRGREFMDILADLPRGLRGYGDYYSGVSNIGSEYGIFDVLVQVEPGRAYRVTMSGSTLAASGAGGILHILRAASGGGAPALSSGEIKRFEHSYTNGLPVPMNATFLWYPTVTVPTVMRVLWSLNKYGTGTATWNGGELMFEDVGLQRRTAGTPNTGGGSTATPVQVYTKRWETTAARTYKGDGSVYTFDTSHMYQGMSPTPGNGNMRSLALFNTNSDGETITQALSGATVNDVKVFYNFQHWYNNAGGTARIGLHSAAHPTLPASFGSTGAVVLSSGWPKPGARWVGIPAAYHAGFKGGTYKGVTLEGDSTLETYGYADFPTLEITYTK